MTYPLKNILKYLLRGVLVFFGILILVYSAAYVYVLAKKKVIISQIREQVADKLNGEVQIADIDLGFLAQFPSISVELQNVSIRDTLFNQHKHPFFQTGKVYASISVLNLLEGHNPLNGLRVENGQLYIFTDTTGYTNSYLLSPKDRRQQSKKQSQKTEIESVKLRNVRLILDDRKKHKLYDFSVNKTNCKISDSDSSITLRTSNNILIHSLAFNTDVGSYVAETLLEGDINLRFNKSRRQLNFEDIDISLKGQPYKLTGTFNFTEAPTFALKVTAKKVLYNEAKSLLTPKIQAALTLVNVEKPIPEVVADISGPLKGGEPLVNIHWKINDNNIKAPFAAFTGTTFDGSFTNEVTVGLPRKDPNSRLEFHNFKGNFEGLAITSQNVYIDNLQFPTIKADIRTDFDLPQLNTLLASNTLDFHEGKGSVNLTYSGPMQNNSNQNTSINGKITFTDGVIMYHPHEMPVSNVTGNIVFKNTDVFVTDFTGNVQGNKFKMNGSGKNLLAFLRTNPGRIFIDWNIYSPSLNLGSLTSLLKQRTGQATHTSRKSKLGKTARDIDAIVNQANFRVDLKADELIYKRFKASNVRASLGLVNENWSLNTVSLEHAGGSMSISGGLTAKNSKYYASQIKADLRNVDVNKVMYAFNDFGQNGITYANLKGKLTSSINIRMDIDRELKGNPSNMDGYIDFSIKKGALLNYDPLVKLEDVVPLNRNFREIYFAELKDRLDVRNKEINLNRMEIQSTLVTFFIEGVYSLRGNTDISIQIPLSNLKKRDENFIPKNEGSNSKVGASIFVRGRPGPDGNIQFKLDLFRKFQKEKEKAAKKGGSGKS